MEGLFAELVTKLQSLNPAKIITLNDLPYSDKPLTLVYPPQPKTVECSTLQGLVDLVDSRIDEQVLDEEDLLAHITSPTTVELISKDSDEYGRRRVWAKATYPECKSFQFGAWLDPESFVISAQQSFQRIKIEGEDGEFKKDLDYVLSVASNITAELTNKSEDDGFTQRVAVKSGIALKQEVILRPTINLAPFRTFAEIDQPLSLFVFRSRIRDGAAHLALFEGDGGRWKIGAAAAIKQWLVGKLPSSIPVIS